MASPDIPDIPDTSDVCCPAERVTQTTTLLPPACRRCGKSLHGRDPAPHQHQVVEIPRLLAQAHDYWLHSLPCEDCHICTRAVLPAGVPGGLLRSALAGDDRGVQRCVAGGIICPNG